LRLGAEWKLVLGLIFVVLVVFLRNGIIGGLRDLLHFLRRRIGAEGDVPVVQSDAANGEAHAVGRSTFTLRRNAATYEGPILKAVGLSKHYGGVIANADIDFTLDRGELRGIIGPNGAGKTTFFKMLTCEVPPTSGTITFQGRNITGMSITDVCQLGLTKSYQVNQLFNRLTVRENLTIGALAALRGKFKLDMLRKVNRIPGLVEQVEHTLELVNLTARRDTPVAQLAYGEKRRLEVGLALASSPTLLLLDEPLAGMSPSERVETVKLLKSIAQGRTMIVIDHDMDALFELAERITVLQEGRILVEGTPDEIKRNAKVQEAYLGGVHGVIQEAPV
jgi:branched-chain amino acid transport system permease protein